MRAQPRAYWIAALALLLSASAWAQPPRLSPADERLFEAVTRLAEGGRLEVRGSRIASAIVLPDFYARRRFTRAWTERTGEELLAEIEASFADGLDPEDYHRTPLRALADEVAANSASDSTLTDYDLLLTDALVRLAYHHLFGKVDIATLDPNWNLNRQIRNLDPAAALEGAITGGDLADEIASLKPKSVLYHGLKSALAEYRAIAERGGWPAVPAGETLKPGAIGDPRLSVLSQRLIAEGDLAADTPLTADTLHTAAYDDSLVAAVERFQEKHGLTADGVIGPGTLAAMNVPVGDRIDQLRVNLERCRWVLREAQERFVVTNVAAFQVFYFEDGKLRWRSRCQVGKEARQTPIFGAEIRYVELNPTWTVPPTIFAKDTLPAVRRDPGYLEQRHLRVIDARGKEIPASQINWATTTPRNFPYMLRQDPGPHCALGRVKFVSPNEHAVYLHDTPSQELFAPDQRAFSSGCIRVEYPLELARLLIDDSQWTAEVIDQTVATEKTTPILLSKPVPAYFLYFTSTATTGRPHFFRDLYHRDPRVLAGLEAEFTFRSQPVIDPKIIAGP